MKFTQRLSLRVRLTLIFLILASVTWLVSSFVAWKQKDQRQIGRAHV